VKKKKNRREKKEVKKTRFRLSFPVFYCTEFAVSFCVMRDDRDAPRDLGIV